MKRLKYIIAIICVFLFLSNNLKAQWASMKPDADSLVKLGSSCIYDCKFDIAEQCFKEVQKRYPEHPVGYFLDAMVEWWKSAVFIKSTKYDDNFLKKIDKVISVCDYGLSQRPYDLICMFFKGGALGYRGRFYVQKESWVKAAQDGSAAFDILMKTYEIAPGNHDIMLGTGLYNYFSYYVPDKYPLVKPLLMFLPRGDKVIGLEQLKAAARNAKYSAIEAQVALLQIYYSCENDAYQALQIAQDLSTKFPNNPYFDRYFGRCLVRVGYMEMFEKVWRNILNKCIDKKFGYDVYTTREALFYIALALKERGDYETALKYLYKCDEACRTLDKDGPSGFMTSTNLWIGKIFDLQGKRNYAVMQYQKVLKMKKNENSHDEAQKYLNTPYKR